MTTQVVLLTNPGDGSLTVPAWALFAKVEVWGAGGYQQYGYAGSGGGYSCVNVLNVTPNATMNYHVATPPSSTNGSVLAGSGQTWFGSTNTVLAYSGAGYVPGSLGIGEVRYSGGSATWAFGSGGGGSASQFGAGGNNASGVSGSSPGGGAGVANGITGVSNEEGGGGGGNGASGGNPGGGMGTDGGGTVYSGRGQIRVTFSDTITLQPLTPTSANVDRNAAVGSNVATMAVVSNGSTLSLANDDAGRFSIVGNVVKVAATLVDGARTVVVRETNPNGANSPNDTTLTVNVGDYVAPTITSSASPSVAENTVNPTGTLTADEAVTWTKVGGADQALFSLVGDTWTLNATPDFETKSSYTVQWRATDTNGNITDQTMTLAIANQFEMGWNVDGPFYELLTSASGNWTVPNGYSSTGSTVECIGKGGNGGSGSSSQSASGGGGGAYSKKNAPNMTAGSVIAYSCSGSAVLTGICSANGGGSGSNTSAGSAGSISGAIGDVKFTGGAGRARVSTNSGGDGGDAGSASGAGSSGSWGTGNGAAGANGTQWGAYGGSGKGGKSRDSGTGVGGAGGAFGAGGGGGRGTGGTGGPGAILITYYTLIQTLPEGQFSEVIPGTGAVSWTPPANCYEIVEARCWGPGGNGGSGSTANGGAGGAFASKPSIAVTPGVAVNGYIGAGGSNLATWFISDTTLKAAAGPNSSTGSSGTNAAAANASIGTVVRTGGAGGGLQTNYTSKGNGGGGASGTASGNGGNGGYGQTGPSNWPGARGGDAVQGGSGGLGTSANNTVGNPAGSDPRGGGGGGGGSNSTGGVGGFPGGGAGGGGFAVGAHGSIEIIYRVGAAPGDTVPPSITSTASISLPEASTLTHTLTADENVAWSIRTQAENGASADAAQFEIVGTTLRFVSNGSRSFASPTDSDANNTYVVVIRATDDASNTSDQTITVTITEVSTDKQPRTTSIQ